MSQEHFLDLVGATNLIPGPNSTEMTMHCGNERAGCKGLITAGLCFIIPAVIITAGFAWMYQQYGTLPEVKPFIYGIKPAIISVIAALIINLGRKALKTAELWIIGILALALSVYGINEIYVLFGAGLVSVIIHRLKYKRSTIHSITPVVWLTAANLKLFWVFLKIGSILYGSGYVLFAFLDTELVQTGLISRQVLVDAIAVGQFTPGPVFSSATFIGWQIGGLPGALAATIGIFLPSFLFVALLNPLIPKLRTSRAVSVFLDAVNVASIAIIASVCIDMVHTSISDWRSLVILIAGCIVSFIFKNLNSAFIIIGGAGAGYVLNYI